jgi:hypothetical protein
MSCMTSKAEPDKNTEAEQVNVRVTSAPAESATSREDTARPGTPATPISPREESDPIKDTSSGRSAEEDTKTSIQQIAVSAPEQTATARREGAWRNDAAYIGAKILRLLLGADGTFQGSYLEGTVSGWLPASEADYVSPASGERAGLWHVRYDKVRAVNSRLCPVLLTNIHPIRRTR